MIGLQQEEQTRTLQKRQSHRQRMQAQIDAPQKCLHRFIVKCCTTAFLHRINVSKGGHPTTRLGVAGFKLQGESPAKFKQYYKTQHFKWTSIGRDTRHPVSLAGWRKGETSQSLMAEFLKDFSIRSSSFRKEHDGSVCMPDVSSTETFYAPNLMKQCFFSFLNTSQPPDTLFHVKLSIKFLCSNRRVSHKSFAILFILHNFSDTLKCEV